MATSDGSDMDMSNSSEEHVTATDAADSPKNDEVKHGADFIAFLDSEDEADNSTGNTNGTGDNASTGNKRKRSVDDDDQDAGPITGPPPGCPWMGHRDYTKLASVPIMLTQELLDFVDYISPTTEEHKVREYVVMQIRKTINTLWPDVDVVVFGSFETKLYLPTSDLDIVLLREGEIPKESLIRLASHIRFSGIAFDVQTILKAKVPLVKFKETTTGISVDVSFNLTNGIDSGQAIAGFIQKLPVLRPLTMLVKYFLMIKGHNEVYQGGIGSYTTVIMILSFLQMHPQVQMKNIDPMDNLGVLLIEFFELYGQCFNYSRVGLAVTDEGSYFEKALVSTGRQSFGRGGPGPEILLTCIDPNDPSNDTARGSFALRKIREVFVGAYGALTQAVQKRHRVLFGNDKRASTSGHIRFDEHNRVAVDSKSKSSGLHRSTQESLIKSVFYVPSNIIRDRQKIAKVFYQGVYQEMFDDPKDVGERIEFKGMADKHKVEQDPDLLRFEADKTPFNASEEPAMNALLYESMHKFKAWEICDISYIAELATSVRQLVWYHAHKNADQMEIGNVKPLSLVKKREAYIEAKESINKSLKDNVPPAEAKEKMKILGDATLRLALEYTEKTARIANKNVAAGRTDSQRDVVYVQAESDDGESSDFFDQLMKEGTKEYGDDDDGPKGKGGRAESLAGHRNPDNVNASEDSIMLPQLL
ncbi:hypothetical protein B0O80DRAFT_469152 [Mortierella sp. GBAus27b]|nr:hypothetical protein B0O80DRAFT_469152 [Mortierella sp. GBAus27b]